MSNRRQSARRGRGKGGSRLMMLVPIGIVVAVAAYSMKAYMPELVRYMRIRQM